MLMFSSEINALVEKLSLLLLQKKCRLVTAESCTGGGLAYYLTQQPGSSKWFERGFITYSNDAKNELLDVPKDMIITHGAVSEETARAMAQGALNHSHAQVAISITGIAGPGGGNADKPTGTVYFGCAIANQNWVERAHFSGDRNEVRQQAILQALIITIRHAT